VHRRLIIVFWTLFFLSVPVVAHAFAPNEHELLVKYRQNYGGLRSFTAEVRFSEEPNVLLRIDWTGGKWRQIWTEASGVSCGAVGVEDSVLASCPDGDFPLPVLLPWHASDPHQAWKNMGLDLNNGEFGFIGNSPSLMFASNATSAMMTFNNENLAPLEVHYPVPGGSLVFKYDDYKTFKGFELPYGGQIIIPGRGHLEFSVNWIAVNKQIDSANFDSNSFVAEHSGNVCSFNSSSFSSLRAMFHSLPFVQ